MRDVMVFNDDMNATHTTRPDRHNKAGIQVELVFWCPNYAVIRGDTGIEKVIDAAIFAAIYTPIG